MINPHLVLLVLIFSVPMTVYGQSPTVDQILAEAAASVGRPGDIAKLKSILAFADCIGPNGTYSTKIASFRTNKTRFEQTYSYKPDRLIVNINEDAVWTVSEKGPDISTAFQRMAARGHEYQKMAFDVRSFFTGLRLAGEEEFEGNTSIKLSGKNELGMDADVHFDKLTKRFSGYVLKIPNSDKTITNVVLEWKRVGNLRLPSVVRATDDQGDWTLRFHTITLNKAVEKLLEIPPRVADIAELLRLHEQQKEAHLSYNAGLFVEMFADQLMQLQRGSVVTRSRSENLARFKSYFSTFNFQEWENIKPPIVKVSNDGSMATIVVQKSVKGTFRNEKGEEEFDHTVFAWLEVWERIDGKWKITTVASTEKNGAN